MTAPLVWGAPIIPSAVPLEYSASQLETFRACARKWAFEKVDGLPKKSTRAAAFGTGVHTQLELKQTGFPFDFSEVKNGWSFSPADTAKIAQTALPYIPAYGTPGLVVEGAFAGVALSAAPWRYKGRIDWRIYARDRLDIGDHKTTADEQWIKSPDDLRTDVQAAIYAAVALAKNPHVDVVKLQWTYMLTKGARRAKVVLAQVSRSENAAVMAHVDAIAKEATDMRRQLKTAIEFPPNYNACDDYGGCPFRELNKCVPTFEERIGSIMSSQPAQPPFMPNFGAPMTPSQGAYAPPGQQAPPAWQGQQAPQGPPQQPAWQQAPQQALQQAPPPQQPMAPQGWPQQQAPQGPPQQQQDPSHTANADLRERSLQYRDQYGRLTKVPAGPCEGLMLPPAMVIGDVWIPSPYAGAGPNAYVRLEPLEVLYLPYIEHRAREWQEYMQSQPQQAMIEMQKLLLPPGAPQQYAPPQQPAPVQTPAAPSTAQWTAPVGAAINAPEGVGSPIPTGPVEDKKTSAARKKAEKAAQQTAPSFTPPSQQPAAPQATTTGELTLYVDCAPSTADFVEAHVLYEAARNANANANASDFASAIENMVKGQLGRADVAIAISTGSAETSLVLARLSSLAGEIVRSRR